MIDTLKTHIQKFQTIHYLVILLAIALQVQVTLFADGDYLGLRISLADFLLPFLGLFVLFSLFTRKSQWPHWSTRAMIFLLIALALVMSVALLNGYNTNGFLSSWSFINKYVGFFLLLSYLMLGAWIVTNAPDGIDVLSLFMGVFTGFFVLTLCLSVMMLFLQFFVPFPLWLPHYPWDGFMANRNAFMVIFVMTFTFVIWGYTDKKTMLPSWVSTLFWLCLPIFFVFNESRTGWIASAALMLIFFMKEPVKRIRLLIPVLLIAVLIAYSSYYITTSATSRVQEGRQMQYLLDAIWGGDKEGLDYFGDQKRYIAIEDGLELYKEHNPLIGAGLGTYKPFQVEKRGEFIDVMDFTGLWLLVETGAVGLLTFAVFYMMCVYSLYRSGFVEGNSPYHRALLVFLVIFAAMSILHELMYMRNLWFAVGLALATRPKKCGRA